MSGKRQQTMAKAARERLVRERRERKLEKKRLRKIEAAERSDLPVEDALPEAELPSADETG